jgi:hypothetical protein
MLILMGTIPWLGGENQLKLDRMIGRISQVWRFGDTSDEITGIPVVCEYTLRPVDICSFFGSLNLRTLLSI